MHKGRLRRPCTNVVAEVNVGWAGLQAKGVPVWARPKDVGRGWTALLLAASPRGPAGRRPAVAMSTLSPALAMEGGRGCGVGSCAVGAVGGWEDERRQRTPLASPALWTRREFSRLLLQAAWPRAAPQPRQAWGAGEAPGPRERPAQMSAASPLGQQAAESYPGPREETPSRNRAGRPRWRGLRGALPSAPSAESTRPLFSASQRLPGP